MDARPHRKLDVWQKSMDLVREIYQTTSTFPKNEEYGLCSQMRRASVSVPSNLAEGAARKGKNEFKQFLNIAQGSLSELDTQVELAHMLGYMVSERHSDLMLKMTEISKPYFKEAIAKLNKRCHPRESGGPEVLEKTGFPLPRE